MPSHEPLSKKIASMLSARVASASSTTKDSSAYKKVADASSAIKNFFVGETSTYNTTADVLREEHKEIWGGTPPEDEAAYRKDVQQKGQAALCLSGGGIRSAAFSLGVLQVLANSIRLEYALSSSWSST